MNTSREDLRRQPLLRMAKRDDISGRQVFAIRAAAVMIAVFIGGILFIMLGHNPLKAYGDMLFGAFGTGVLTKETIKTTVPLLITAIGISYAFKMQFWNIGGEGQILVGGIGSAYWAFFYADKLPRIPLILLMILTSMLLGGLYGLLPALFKAKWGTNETLFTLMLNYMALNFIIYLENGPWKAKRSSFPKMPMINKGVYLSTVMGVHWGWIVALILIAVTWFYFSRTKQGYEVTVVGESNNTARYAGINVGRVFRRTMFLSGALIGLVGFFQVAGADHTLNESTAGGVGFTAITVAWLAHMNPAGMGIVALAIAILERGCTQLETTLHIPSSVSDILIGLILFSMLACEFFVNYRLILRKTGRKEVHS